MAKHLPYKGSTLLVSERDRRIEQMLLSGVTNHYEIAAAFGMGRQAVTKVVAKIYKGWANSDPELEALRRLRQRQFENIYRLAIEGYESSTRRCIGTKKVPRECEFCSGVGLIEDKPKEFFECKVCAGSGVIEEEVPEYIRVQGDSSFLRIAKDTLAELTKLEGLGPATTSSRTIISTSREIGGVIEQKVEEIYAEAPPDTLIRALCVMSELRENHDKKKMEEKGRVRVINNPADRKGEED